MSLAAASAPSGRLPAAAVATLAAHQRRVGAGPHAEANVARLADGGTWAVVAGQQPGLLGGPLLSLYKAVGAITRARALSASTGRTVVPVFWVASEDHDVAEIDRAVVIDAAGEPRALSLGLRSDRRSVSDKRPSSAEVDSLLSELRAALPATVRGAAAVELVRPLGEIELGAWFATILARILGDTGLVFVEPAHLAPHSGETFGLLLDEAERIEAALKSEGDARRARGEAAPLERVEHSTALFLRKGPGWPRERVTVRYDDVRLRGEPAAFDRRGLGVRLRGSPELASGDVVGRVFVQNALLPVAEIVGGPTELAYLAQVRAAARALGREFPGLVARPAAVVIDEKASAALATFGLTAEDVAGGVGLPHVADAGPDALSVGLDELARSAAALRARALLERGSDGGPSAVARELDAVRESLERAARRRADEREATLGRGRARFERLTHLLRPLGESQERVLSPISCIARHGVEAVREAALSLEPGAPIQTLVLT